MAAPCHETDALRKHPLEKSCPLDLSAKPSSPWPAWEPASSPPTKPTPRKRLRVAAKPVIQYAVEEAREAGIEQFVFITGRGKHVIEHHFDHAYELESLREARGHTADLN